MFGVLSKEPDFLAQKPWLAESAERNLGCFIFLYLKYHCELTYIKMVWGWIKAHHRNYCKYNYPALKKGLPITLDELMPMAFVRRAFNHCFDLWLASTQASLVPFLSMLKKYKSHRRLSPNLKLDTIVDEFTEHREKKSLLKAANNFQYAQDDFSK